MVTMITTERLSWDNKSRRLSGFASDFGFDKLPKVIDVKSHHTGKIEKFFWFKTNIDEEEEVTEIVYRNNKLRISLHLAND